MKSLKIVILFSILKFFWAQFNPICGGKRYMCDYNDLIVNPLDCTFVEDLQNKLRVIKPCSNPNYPICNWEIANVGVNGTCIPAAPSFGTLPGEQCSYNGECHSNNCQGGVCVGLSYNSTCTNDEDCDLGLYCFNITSTCQFQQQFDANCTRDNECTNNCACNMGRCVYYYSFDNFLPADNPAACLSGYVKNQECYPSLQSEIKGRPCNSDADCIAYDSHTGENVEYGTCQCGFNGGGFTYCPLIQGDPEFQDILNALEWVVATSYPCHTSLRFGPCHSLYWDEYIRLQKAMIYFQMYPQLVYNDPCVKKAITYQYWGLSTKRISVSAVMMVLILILYHL